MGLIAELQRRNVFRVAALYVVGSWLTLQIGDLLFDLMGLPDFALRIVLGILLLGLPAALVLAWIYELTPEGVKRDRDVDRTASIAPETGRKLNVAVLVAVVLALGALALDRLLPADPPAMDTGLAPATASEGQVAPTAPAEDGERSIAVLPFANLSSDPENEYFADGLSEEILNVLAQIPDLKVAGRTSAFAFKGRNEDLREIGRTLGVATILEGSVRRQGNQVRITAQLIESGDGTHLWSATYDRTLEDVFAIQDDIARNVTRALEVVLDDESRARMSSAGVRNVDAFMAFQKAAELAQEAHSGERLLETLAEADHLFAESLEHAPDFSQAWFQRADYYAHLALDGPPAGRGEALREHQRMLGEAHDHARNPARRAFIAVDRELFGESWGDLLPRVEEALTVEGCPHPTWIQMVTMLGFAEPMHGMYQRTVACDPLAFISRLELANTALWMGDADAALTFAEASLERFRDEPNAVYSLQLVLMALGRHDEAVALSERISIENEFVGLLGHVVPLAAAGRMDEARAAYERWQTLKSLHDDSNVVAALAVLGDREGANRLASRLDEEPAGAMSLLSAIYSCACGRPFDLEATPNFASRLDHAGIDWHPPVIIRFPAKDW